MNEVIFDESAVETENSADTRSRTRNQRPLSEGRFSLSSIRCLTQLTLTPLGMRAEADRRAKDAESMLTSPSSTGVVRRLGWKRIL